MAIPLLDPTEQKKLGPPGPVPDQTFELGLVLGGTVSAGAFTAGALDLLVQALDSFQVSNGAAPPPHQVKLRLAAGSSGGAVCASLLGISLNRQFSHAIDPQATLNADGAGPADNKFWDVWVNRLSFAGMLAIDDLANAIQDPAEPADGTPPPVQRVPSLLNSKVIDSVVATVVSYGAEGGDITRAWALSPFRLATTVCNLRGMPFRVGGAPAIGAFTGSAYIEHDDYTWFAIPNVLGTGDGAIDSKRPNEFWLSANPTAVNTVSYDTLGNYARASGSMPLGLPARPLSRPAEHYLYRPSARIDDGGNVIVNWPMPDWSELPDVAATGNYTFVGVDGGTLNNDPVKIAHDALTGVGLHNPQSPASADRALLLIDPLADNPTTVDPVGRSFMAVLKLLPYTLIGGARYLTADLDLFQDQDVFSRFQLVPTRTGFDGQAFPGDAAPADANGNPLSGGAALAGTDMFALAGWCARPFRVHDFLLGRFNMAAYLRRELILRADNPLFDNWPLALIQDYCLTKGGDRFPTPVMANTDKTTYYLPVIPMPADNFGVVVPTWPSGALDPSSLNQPLGARVGAVVNALRADNLPGLGGWLLSVVMALSGVAETITDDIIEELNKALVKRKLWT